jgi:hypothetical protein
MRNSGSWRCVNASWCAVLLVVAPDSELPPLLHLCRTGHRSLCLVSRCSAAYFARRDRVPLLVAERADIPRAQPSRDAVQVEHVAAAPAREHHPGVVLRHVLEALGLHVQRRLVQAVAADGARICGSGAHRQTRTITTRIHARPRELRLSRSTARVATAARGVPDSKFQLQVPTTFHFLTTYSGPSSPDCGSGSGSGSAMARPLRRQRASLAPAAAAGRALRASCSAAAGPALRAAAQYCRRGSSARSGGRQGASHNSTVVGPPGAGAAPCSGLPQLQHSTRSHRPCRLRDVVEGVDWKG